MTYSAFRRRTRRSEPLYVRVQAIDGSKDLLSDDERHGRLLAALSLITRTVGPSPSGGRPLELLLRLLRTHVDTPLLVLALVVRLLLVPVVGMAPWGRPSTPTPTDHRCSD